MDNQQERISEDITGDLAAAVRKSWSEPQDNPLLLNFNNSPIGTPTDRYSPEPVMMMEGNAMNPPSLARGSAQHQQRPVSYTHLDVYKRQVFTLLVYYHIRC